jgi:hypothetical protein
MTVTLAKPILRTYRRDEGRRDDDPAELSATLRELALRVHRLVLAAHGLRAGADSSGLELTDVHAQIVRLHGSLHSYQLCDPATYVSALRQRVEECMACADESETRTGRAALPQNYLADSKRASKAARRCR